MGGGGGFKCDDQQAAPKPAPNVGPGRLLSLQRHYVGKGGIFTVLSGTP